MAPFGEVLGLVCSLTSPPIVTAGIPSVLELLGLDRGDVRRPHVRLPLPERVGPCLEYNMHIAQIPLLQQNSSTARRLPRSHGQGRWDGYATKLPDPGG